MLRGAQLLSLTWGNLMDSRSDSAWFVIPPFALADTPLDLVVAVICLLLLSVIFVIEILTPPSAVVAAFALIPLASAMWTLSGRFATLVLGATMLLFVAAAVMEPENRLTLALIAIPILAIGVVARLYIAEIRSTPAVPVAPQDDGRQPLAALTRRELEVARLAASAYTAAEIGHRLHIGERTVESHLASTYLKLGITSRSQLIRMAERFH
jgi:DNA-binding CsgD family transcriptional regulator